MSLWRLIATPTRRGTCHLCGQADPSYFRRYMGCNGLAILIAALADENGGAARRRRHTLVRASPMEVYGAGSSGAAGLLLRARGSVSWQRALRATSSTGVGWKGGAAWKCCSIGLPG